MSCCLKLSAHTHTHMHTHTHTQCMHNDTFLYNRKILTLSVRFSISSCFIARYSRISVCPRITALCKGSNPVLSGSVRRVLF